MFGKRGWLLTSILLLLVAWGSRAQAQTATAVPAAATATPVATTPQPTAQPTEPPAILVIQPTPVPSVPLSGNIWGQMGQVWARNRQAILLAGLIALVTGVLVGVLIKPAAAKLTDWTGRLFRFLFDRFAAAPLIRLRYERAYRETVAAAVQQLQGGNLVQREIRLDKMYVPALLTQEMRPEARGEFVDRYRTREELRQRQKDEAVGPWQAVRQFHRFVVLGGPGAGKTTYLYHLAFMCAHRRRPEVARHIPIFIRFRELVRELKKLEQLEDIFAAIFADHNFPNASAFIERQLQNGRCLLLLDGLDEVASTDDHQRLIELVQEFANRHVRGQKQRGSHNILVVSSRKYSYEHGPQLGGFPKTEVMEFDAPAIERFAHNWFGGDSDLADELVAALKGNKRFLELARNPLLLLLIAYHYQRERNLPHLRAELYRHCIRTRITQWNTIRGTHRGRFGENMKWRLLRQLAIHIFQQEEEGLLWRNDLLDWLETFAAPLRLPADATPETLLDEVARTSGLIQEWAINRYGFSHQTLQEFFAAEAADRLGAEKGAALLAEYLHDPAWKEVILLYCGLAEDASPLLQRMIARARQPDGGSALWLMAGQCLAEGAQAVGEPARRQLAAALVALLRPAGNGQPLTAAESGQVVANLQEFAHDLLPAHISPLLDSGQSPDLFLAEQLLPHDAPAELRTELSRRLAALAGSVKAEERQAAVAALGRLGVEDAAAAAALLAGLADPDPAARAEAAAALGRQGRAGEDVAAALRRLYESDPQDVPRHAALDSLLALGRAGDVGMVFIPAGEFLMGSADDDPDADSDEKPQHRLYLPAYFMDARPVTNAQFGRFMEAGGYANPAYWPQAIEAGRWKEGKYVDYFSTPRDQPEYWDGEKWNGDQQPVVGVSWYEAMAYARWAGKRLPTEAEWEKAARGDDGRLYPWGDTWDPSRTNSEESGHKRTTPVGQFSPAGDSPYDAADMVGNVWEWCSSRWWDENQKEYGYAYSPDDGREDLSGGDSVVRVLRGGSWYNGKKSSRCAARYGVNPDIRNYDGGFRCCCAPSSLLPSGSGS